MSAHTKGPWHWDADEYGYGTDGVRRWRYRVTALGRTIMQTYYIEEQRGQAEADTRLAAAAPELLEALKLAVRQNSGDMVMTGDELRKCEAALAKVTSHA